MKKGDRVCRIQLIKFADIFIITIITEKSYFFIVLKVPKKVPIEFAPKEKNHRQKKLCKQKKLCHIYFSTKLFFFFDNKIFYALFPVCN